MRSIFLKILVLVFIQTLCYSDDEQLCDSKLNFIFKNKPSYSIFTLDNPTRLVLDFNSNAIILNDYNENNYSKCIKKSRLNLINNLKTRIVYEFTKPIKVSHKLLNNQDNYTLILDTSLSSSTKNGIIVKSKDNEKPKQKVVKSPKIHKPQKTLRDIVIVIDPGHGGNDPGAISASGIQEKDITLAIGKQLAAKINKIDGLKAYLTRKSDRYIELRKRTEIAQDRKADLFISIHADSHPSSKASGVSVYALSESGATSEAARILADKENSLYDGKSKQSHHGYILESVLIDLQQVATVHQSLIFGKKILKNVTKVAKKHSNQVEQAAFVVLKCPYIPSVLVESGFVSNKKEAKKLVNASYQNSLSQAFLNAVIEYLKEKKLKNTFFNNNFDKKYVKVNTGDTLTSIARQYRVKVDDILHVNNIAENKIYIGQTLILPILN